MTQNYYYIGNSGYVPPVYGGPESTQAEDEGARNEAPQMAIDWIKIARQALARWANYELITHHGSSMVFNIRLCLNSVSTKLFTQPHIVYGLRLRYTTN